MRLLAIDASTFWGGAALLEWEGGSSRLIAETGLYVESSHAAQLLPLVDGLLATAGWQKGSLDAYVAVRGPGSFTGIRVALGLISGLALASERPCVGVGTLDAMAEAHGPAIVDRVPLLDAGRGEVYGGRFDARATPPEVRTAAWVGDPALALVGDGGVVVFGTGASVHELRLREAGYRGPVGRVPTSVAAGAGRIALAQLAAGTTRPLDMTPLYVRPSDAEVRFR